MMMMMVMTTMMMMMMMMMMIKMMGPILATSADNGSKSWILVHYLTSLTSVTQGTSGWLVFIRVIEFRNYRVVHFHFLAVADQLQLTWQAWRSDIIVSYRSCKKI